MSLGWDDGRLEGDMGLEPDGLPSPHPSNQPQQTGVAGQVPAGESRGFACGVG